MQESKYGERRGDGYTYVARSYFGMRLQSRVNTPYEGREKQKDRQREKGVEERVTRNGCRTVERRGRERKREKQQ